MSQQRLADLVGEDQTTISQWERGRIKTPGRDKLLALAAALDLTWEEVARAAGLILVVTPSEEVHAGADEVPVPWFGSVPADTVRWVEMEHRGESVDIPRSWVDQARSPVFAVTVSGDCLRGHTPAISDGDVVVCETYDGRAVPNGKLVLARVGSEYSLKLFFRVGVRVELRDGDGHVVYTLVEADDFEILGTYHKRFSS